MKLTEETLGVIRYSLKSGPNTFESWVVQELLEERDRYKQALEKLRDATFNDELGWRHFAEEALELLQTHEQE